MAGHRITYEVLETRSGTRYRATCRCGHRRTATSTAAVSSWGPAHVVTEYEVERGR